ncbi:MAG: acyl-CoA desaturase [Friedmanniella sp.]|nr:acyl-CoA desaturase [Friedmanniella sp.]
MLPGFFLRTPERRVTLMTAPALSSPRPARPHGAASPTSDFTTLAHRVQALGLMRRRYGYYAGKLSLLIGLVASCAGAAAWLGDSWLQLVVAVALALVLTQLAFLGHDAAHRQIFVSGRRNDAASLLIATGLVGISYGWWRSKHGRHHAHPNTVGSDPDIDLPAVAFTPEQAEERRYGWTRWLARHQGAFFFPLLVLEGLSLHLSGFRRLLGRAPVERRALELSLLTLRMGGYVALLFWALPPDKAAAFLALQLAVFGFYLGAAFAPNHIGMPLVARGLRLDFLRRQVLMSRDVAGGRVLATLMGGLNYQIEHHLFPSMARPFLRQAQPLVAAYCAELSIPYARPGLWRSYGQVTRYLNQVGRRGQDPFLCPLVASRRSL